LTKEVKHQEASLKTQVEFHSARVSHVFLSYAARSVLADARHYTQRPNGLATKRARGTC